MEASVPAASGDPAATDPYTYIRRRRLAATAAIVACPAVLLIILSTGFSGGAGTPSPIGPSAAAGTHDADTRVSTGSLPGIDEELAAAAAHRESTGSYAGYPAKLPHAANSVTVVVTSGTGQECVYAGVVDGTTTPVVADDSGQACDPVELAALQVELDRQDAARRVSATAGGDDRLDRAAAMAARAAAANYVDGHPSFVGITALPLSGVAVVPADTTDRVVLRTTTGPCRQLTVLADGSTSTPTGC